MHTTRHFNASTILLIAGLCCLASCSLFGPTKTKVDSIQLSAQLNANQNTATALDIVFVYDSNALSILPKNGPTWFQNKTALLNGLAANIDVVSLEVPPATLLDVKLPSRHRKAIAVYCFPNYLNVAGQSLGNITPYKSVRITLTPTTVQYTEN